ncbi:MAG: hybrid sensor histidine kinase/response regulator [bacterium]
MNIVSSELLAVAGILYISLLFYIAFRGDRADPNFVLGNSGLVYSLSLAVYCSSWTFFGAVGTAASRGWDFFAIYLGPILLFLFGYRLIQRIIIISKQQNITSVSDFISSRYGKSRKIAVLVTCIAVLGSLPYISLQLQAISMAFLTVTTDTSVNISGSENNLLSDIAFYSAIILATFTILFGTRHLNATEHHRGLIQAIAFESVVKLLAILLVGYFCYRILVDSPNLIDSAWLNLHSPAREAESSWSKIDFVTRMLLSMGAILFLPRQFHVTVVEADSHHQINTARWMLPAYLILVSLVVLPIAITGNYYLPQSSNADLYVLNLPLAEGNTWLALLAFVGGLSAATGMVIVAAISLSTMVCNDIVMPMLINIKRLNILHRHDLNRIILTIRRIVIVAIMMFSYGYYRLSDTSQGLANIGLLSFAAIIQFAPAAIIGLYWQRANRRGALLGLSLGSITWAYCLLVPNFVGGVELNLIFATAPWMHPQHLLGITGLSPLTHGVFWSLTLNLAGLIIGSIRFHPSLLDKIQASLFAHTTPSQPALTQDSSTTRFASFKDARTLCESIIGEQETTNIFSDFENQGRSGSQNQPVNRKLVQKIEKSIASVIGASSARHVVAKTLLGEDFSAEDMVVLMDETSQAISFNRELLQAGFENISQGISVVDKDLRVVAWNNRYIEIFDYPLELLYIGMPVEELIRFNAERGECGPGDIEVQVNKRLDHLRAGTPHVFERKRSNGRYVRSQGNPMPGGGFVTSYTDTTEQKNNEQALRESEQNIRFYTDNLPLMLCYVDKNRRIQFSNKAYNLALGLPRESVIGQPVLDLLNDENTDLRERHIKTVLSGQPVKFTIQNKDQKGNLTHYLINYIPQFDDASDVSGFFSFYQDITQNVAAEELLRKVNEELENRVAERTRDLEQVNEKLQNVTEGKTRFLAAASHDLLQPINAARLFNQSITEHSPPSDHEIRNLADKVDHSLVSADKLLRALLDISKLDAGSMTPEFDHFDIYELLQELEVEMGPLAEQYGLQLIMRKRHIGVRSDRRLLRSMLQNFVSNAIRYTERGSILIGCRKRGEHLEIQVLDTGIGIEGHDFELIFREFHRLKASSNNLGEKGLGLGLAITHRLSKILNHPIDVMSVFGKGSRFSVTVPLHKGNIIRYPVQKTWSPMGKLDGLKVLCLEDVEEVLEATRILLTKWDCAVTPCRSIEQARVALNEGSFDVIIADYSLGGQVTGLDFLVEARNAGCSDYAIILSAEQDPSIRSRTQSIGFYYLSKPVDPSSLRTLLRRARQKDVREESARHDSEKQDPLFEKA